LAYFTIGKLKKLAADGHEAIYLQITKNHLYDLYEVVNKSDHQIIDSIKRELKASKARIAFASFFTTIVFLISLYVFMLRSSIEWIAHLRNSTYVTSGMLLFTLGILLYMLKLNRYPVKYYGINTKNWRNAVPEAVVWSLGFIALATFAKWVWYVSVPGHEGKPLWGLPEFEAGNLRQSLIYMSLYTLFAPIQEFFARGVIQGTLQKFLTGRFVKLRAIAIATLLFSVTHVHLDLAFAFMVIIPSILWGIMYARQDSLLGVSLSHILIGLYITFVLGFV
jgi:membrane protease YdiL (CAAX protease family)